MAQESSKPKTSPSLTPKTLGSDESMTEGTPVPGSQILSTTTKPQPGSAEDYLVKKIVELEKVIQGIDTAKGEEATRKNSQVRTLVSGVLDLNTLGHAALARYWDQLGKTAAGRAERDKYMKVFKELVEENYLEKARTYVGGKNKIVLTGEKTSARGTIVSGLVKKTDVDLQLEFRMKKEGSQWKVLDVRLDEMSLEETYRGNFNRIIQKKGGVAKGVPELIHAMETRLKELKSGKATRI